VLVKNGTPVAPGEPLVRLVGEGPLWAKARFVVRPGQELVGAKPVALRIGGQRVELGTGAELLSTRPIVDQNTQIASWTASLGDLAAADDQRIAVKPGMAAVMLVRVGVPQERLAVPLAAVTEINTFPFIFVQTGGESFHKRRVSLGVRDGGFVEVLEGVSAGERVVTRGGFDIHLAAVMGSVVSHRH
jgi:multidrug efflux pump subunit AcrA (membrane-fusion protein)